MLCLGKTPRTGWRRCCSSSGARAWSWQTETPASPQKERPIRGGPPHPGTENEQ
jgi:hypothetical protein